VKAVETEKPVITVKDQPAAVKPAVKPDVKPTTPPQSEFTTYIVQRGDYLAKISKKFNIRVDAIRKANPSIKKDVVRVGQKIKLPGKVEVGEQKVPQVATSSKTAKTFKAYEGATKEYVVKSGDTLGAIAYGNGINIRQLKKLNNLANDNLRVGQKLKVPATKVEKAPAARKQTSSKPVEKKDETPAVPVVQPESEQPAVDATTVVEEPNNTETAAAAVANDAVKSDEQPAANDAAAKDADNTYIVKEGDDITGVAIRWAVTAAAIRELNGLGENDQLVPGQVIKLPPEAQQQ
jgi:LysM repeat protein